MIYVAVMVLAVLGLVELILRCVVALASIVFTLGLILMVDADFAGDFLKPLLLDLTVSLAHRASPK